MESMCVNTIPKILDLSWWRKWMPYECMYSPATVGTTTRKRVTIDWQQCNPYLQMDLIDFDIESARTHEEISNSIKSHSLCCHIRWMLHAYCHTICLNDRFTAESKWTTINSKVQRQKKKTNERMVPVGKPGRHRSRDDANGTYLMSIFFC